jgi:hypothetical protein
MPQTASDSIEASSPWQEEKARTIAGFEFNSEPETRNPEAYDANRP